MCGFEQGDVYVGVIGSRRTNGVGSPCEARSGFRAAPIVGVHKSTLQRYDVSLRQDLRQPH
jgi:hypothetical protein